MTDSQAPLPPILASLIVSLASSASPSSTSTPTQNPAESYSNYAFLALSPTSAYYYRSLSALMDQLPPLPLLLILLVLICCGPTWVQRVIFPKIKESLADAAVKATISLFYTSCFLLVGALLYYYPPFSLIPYESPNPLLPSTGDWTSPSLFYSQPLASFAYPSWYACPTTCCQPCTPG